MKAGDFVYISGSVGVTTTGSNVAPSIVERVQNNKWKDVRMLDICCGVGTLGIWTLVELGPSIVKHLVLSDIKDIHVESCKMNINKFRLNNVTAVLGNCFENVPKEPYDLIVSNPPCCYGEKGDRNNVDIRWEFHKDFFKSLHSYLTVGGEAWLIEHKSEKRIITLAEETINKEQVNISATDPEPRDPTYYWLRLRRFA